MSDTMPTSALAGLISARSSQAGPYTGVVCAASAPGRDRGPAAGGFATVRVPVRNDEPAGRHLLDQQSIEHDGTTLGIHSSRGPQG